MILIMWHKYKKFLLYIWSKLNLFDFLLQSENGTFYEMEGVPLKLILELI